MKQLAKNYDTRKEKTKSKKHDHHHIAITNVERLKNQDYETKLNKYQIQIGSNL